MVDILYIYKHSKNNGEELKYSLRSLEKYVSNYGKIFITGDCPDFIDKSKVIHTPAQDIGYPMVNHWWKVRETIKKTNISNNFVLMYIFCKANKVGRLSELCKGYVRTIFGGWLAL